MNCMTRIQSLSIAQCVALAVSFFIATGTSQDDAGKRAEAALSDQMGKFLGFSAITEARKAKITTLALSAYKANNFRPLWGKFTELEDESVYHQILKNHGMGPEMMKVRLPTGNETSGARSTWLSLAELRKTLWFAEFCLLLNEGPPGNQKSHWMSWKTQNSLDNSANRQLEQLSERFAKAILSGVTLTDRLEKNFEPNNWVYQGLLKAYKKLANPDQGKDQPSPEANRGPTLYIEKSIKAGDRFFRSRELADYLFSQGFLTEDQLEPISTFYSEELKNAMAKFQDSRGLKADGILGPQTAELIAKGSIPVVKKSIPTVTIDKEKLLLNLNRARQLPNEMGNRHLFVNLPSAELLAVEGNRKEHRVNLLVGSKEVGKQTPILHGKIDKVVFQPYWILSPNAAYEYLPKVRRDSSYLKRHSFQIVNRDGEPQDSTSDNLDRVQSGELFFRQVAGKNNSLGRVLLQFPNFRYIDFYASTRSDLLKKIDRAVTDGRVGLDKPDSLINWLLANNSDQRWDPETINQAMWGEARQKEVLISEPVKLYIVYFTVLPEESGLASYSDCYNLDQ